MSNYVMPRVTIGQVVMWKHSPSSSAAPAVVTAVYSDKIDCSVFVTNCKYVLPKSAVRYTTDPILPTLHPEAAGDGVFELTERDKQIDGLIRSFYDDKMSEQK
jgi:hypothetical protein